MRRRQHQQYQHHHAGQPHRHVGVALPLPGRRAVIGLVACIALIVASVLLLSEQTPPGGRVLQSIFEDDELLVDSPLNAQGTAVVARTLATMKALGADRIRVIVVWQNVAPGNTMAVKPRNFDAANPADYGGGWARLDRVDRMAAADGLSVFFDLSAGAPRWATTPIPQREAATLGQYASVYAPNAAEFERFVEAAGRRYDGSFTPANEGRALPRVSFWSVWNEPNQPGWLSPQQNPNNGQPLAPELYRDYADAFWNGLQSSGHTPATDTILVGELAPEGCAAGSRCPGFPAGDDPIAPLPFLADLYCVTYGSRHTLPLTGSAAVAVGCPADGNRAQFVADNPPLFELTGLSEHPYAFSLAPTKQYPLAADSGFAPLSEIARLETSLDNDLGAYGSTRQPPLYLTEYGYVTNPPNPHDSVTPAQQATYLDQATYMAYTDSRVRALAQFELEDSPVTATGASFQEGLEFLNGKPKPAFYGYRLPIYVPDPTMVAGGTIAVWGMLRAAPNDSTQVYEIQWAPGRSDNYRTLATGTTRDPSGFLTEGVTPPASGQVRIAWASPTGVIYSDSVPVIVH